MKCNRRRSDFLRGIALAISAALVALVPAHAQEAESGERLYYVHGCYGCHGFDGKSRIMPLSVETSGVLADETSFLSFLRMRADQNPTLPSTRMPNYPEASLTDDDARAIYQHILAIQSRDPDVEDAPLLRSYLDAADE